GLGLALKKPLIHIPTVDALAYQVYGCEDIICPIMDARRSQVYTGLYTFSRRAGEKEYSYEAEPVFQVLKMQMAVSIEELTRHLNVYRRPVIFLGDGVPVFKDFIEEKLQVPYSFAPPHMNRQRAAAVGALSIQYYKAGKIETAMEHKPDYLRVSQAERERAQREKEAELIVRPLSPEDAAAVSGLEFQIFTDFWSERSVLDTINQPESICIGAEKSGRLAGYVLAYDVAGEAEIARIAVEKESRRQGVGKSLMLKLEEICEERDIRKILLDVRQSNEAARTFYREKGFREDGIRQNFYDGPKEDAVLMSRESGK
ncbi:ribosomal protein S18-alanine N-acetyltransferase, partial [Muricomes intestini]